MSSNGLAQKSAAVSAYFPGLSRRTIYFCFGLSLLLHLIAAFFSEGYQNHDEHFRILEMMHRRLLAPMATDTLERCPECLMFSFFQPATLGLAVKGLTLFGITNPFTLATIFRFFSALLGWVSLIAVAYSLAFWVRDVTTRRHSLYALCFVWFFPYLHARPSPESWAGSFFFISLGLMHFVIERGKNSGAKKPFIHEILVGGLWAFAFSCRYQMGVVILFVALWYLFLGRADGSKRWWSFARMCFGFLLVALAVEGINTWGYGFWYPTHWNYLDRLVFKGGVLHQFASGRWFYFREVFLQGGPPFSILLIAGTILGWILFPRHVLTWVTASFFVVHQIMAHKQINYLFPVAKGAVVLSVMSLNEIYCWLKSLRVKSALVRLRPYAVGMNFALLFLACVFPSSTVIGVYKYLYAQQRPISLLSVDGDCFEVVGFPITFYRRAGTEVKKFPDYFQLESAVGASTEISWIGRKGLSLPKEAEKLQRWCKLTYAPFPNWVTQLNFNGWIERSRIWSIYQCQKPQS